MAINIPFFEYSSQDQSVAYLGQIFGPMGTILTPTQAPLIFGKMFNTLNTVILTVGVLIVVYVTIVGVIKTAHEGEPLGKQWSTLWLPLRMVIGIAALIPSTTGYSFLQIIIMWVIVQGVGAADSIWTTTLKYYDAFGSLTAKVSTTAGLSAASDMQTLFQIIVCQATASYSTVAVDPPSGYQVGDGSAGGSYCADHRTDCSLNSPSSSGMTSTTQFGPGNPGACGTMVACNKTAVCADSSAAGQISCAACTAQTDALDKIMGLTAPGTVNVTIGEVSKTFVDFKTVAGAFAEADYQYRKLYDRPLDISTIPKVASDYCNANGISLSQCCGTPPYVDTSMLPPGAVPQLQNCALKDNFSAGIANGPDKSTVTAIYWPYLLSQLSDLSDSFIQTAADYYTLAITTAVNEAQSQIDSSGINQAGLQDARDKGWLYAGAFYYSLSSYNNQNQASATPTLQILGSDPAAASNTSSNALYNYRNNYTAAGYLVEYVTQQMQSAGTGGTPGGTGINISSNTTSFPSQVSGLSKVTSSINGFAGWMLNDFMQRFTGSQSGVTNPLVNVQSYGRGLLIALQVIFFVLLTILVVMGIIGFVNGSILGNTVSNPVGPTLTLLAIVFTPLMSALLGGLFMFAALLAIYTPLIPFIIFTVGALAWFILVVEAIIAGPLVALGLLLPGGQSELFGRAENALMLLFSIFF